MRRKFLIIGLALAVIIASVLLALNGSSRGKKWPEVIFQGTTNTAGTNVALFRIVNHGPAPVMLWLPPRLKTDAGWGPEIRSFKGESLNVGESITTTVAFPQQTGKWQAAFLYDYEGWRSTLEDWEWIEREQKWACSEWLEP